MSSSDDSDSDITVSSESDTESIISESEEDEEAGFDEIDHEFSDGDNGNQVSESVFLEGTESALNLMFFAGGSIAGGIAQTSDTNRTTDQPKVQTAGISSPVPVLFAERCRMQIPDTENNLDHLDLGSDDVSSEDNTALSHANQGSNAARALEASVYRDMCRDHLNTPFSGQNYGTSNTTSRLVDFPHNPGFLGWLGWRFQRIFLRPNIYASLPSPSHIRVLLIQPGVNEDTLVASFELLDLNAANIRFEAISYQWSEGGGQKSSMRLGGEQISINAYLQSILLHLRLEQHIRVVWADALCINQSDHAERLQQVSIMQRIYSQAFRVIGFVGKDYTHASKCFNAIKALTSAWFEVWKNSDRNNGTSSTPDNIFGCVQNDASMCRIVEVFQSGYWKRLWVVQELVSSRRAIIRWGDAEISWTLLGLATTLIRNNKSLMTIFNRISKSKKSPGPFQGGLDARTGLMNAYLMYRMSSTQFRGDSMSFLDVLRLTRNFDVSERLDRIYAILGLPSQHTGPGRTSIPPDYRLLPDGLYSRVFYWVYQTHDNPLETLSAVRHTTLFYPDFPTWIPRWHVKPPIRSIGISHRASMKFNASAGWKPNPPTKLVWSQNERYLILQGFVLGSVTSAYRVFPTTNKKDRLSRHHDLKNLNIVLDHWLNENVRRQDDLKAQLSLVLTAGQDWYGNILKEQNRIDEHTASFLKWSREYLKNTKPGDEEAVRYEQAVDNVCRGRQIFTATNSLLGLGPNLLKKGDLVCVVAGGPVPYILRPLGDDTFYFVGECYVAGYMFGEAVSEWRSQARASLSLRRFTLR
ncbi:heterokaryon incompatibility 6 OR allele [Fusarium mundagurra]|uniref:Heterokaryon incompatibility 6 OR allele n=1 Tax=Fusarium mundagurra TaxID=1567541 RepID=A0A8H5YY97_9HYPO|nr:heterokaryon incompatibility 6 OR allele [Fusarium mundagurra]